MEDYIKNAHYKCRRCGYEWIQKSGMVTCKCGHIYVDWINHPLNLKGSKSGVQH